MKATLSALLLGAAVAAAAEVVTLPHPGQPLPAGRTVVWSPLFQAGWDALNAKLGGPPNKVEPPNALMAKLDTFRREQRKEGGRLAHICQWREKV